MNIGHCARDLASAQPLATLTWSTNAPTCAQCTYEQKADSVRWFEGGSSRTFETRRITSGQVGRCDRNAWADEHRKAAKERSLASLSEWKEILERSSFQDDASGQSELL